MSLGRYRRFREEAIAGMVERLELRAGRRASGSAPRLDYGGYLSRHLAHGCGRGGRIYDLASLLAGGPCGERLRGDAFRAARERVAAALR